MATLSEKIRHAAQPLMKFQQFCDVKEAFGKGKHDELVYDKENQQKQITIHNIGGIEAAKYLR